jgi:hypothetical protein
MGSPRLTLPSQRDKSEKLLVVSCMLQRRKEGGVSLYGSVWLVAAKDIVRFSL